MATGKLTFDIIYYTCMHKLLPDSFYPLIEGNSAESDPNKMSLQVVREVSGQSAGPEESASPLVPRKTDLDKVSKEEWTSTSHNSYTQLR